ncbi:hypothetical protein BD413DRAFT_491925 [Trametes elegans]|nr:hypothetical protein BD413DRAFT_491925 [Trametes elegans]
MPDHKSSHWDVALRSAIIDIGYPEDTVGAFIECGNTVFSHLRSASDSTPGWLSKTREALSRNLDWARGYEYSIGALSSEAAQTKEHRKSAAEQIVVLERATGNSENTLASAEPSLSSAKSKQDDQQAVGVVRTILEFMLFLPAACSSEVLDAKRIARCRENPAWLRAQAAELQAQREMLARLSATINDTLHAIGAALASAVVVAEDRSMHNITTGIRGVVAGLSTDGMLAGPFVLLDETALGVLLYQWQLTDSEFGGSSVAVMASRRLLQTMRYTK